MFTKPLYANATRVQLKALLMEYADATYFDVSARRELPLLPLMETTCFERGHCKSGVTRLLNEMQAAGKINLSPDALFFNDFPTLFLLYMDVQRSGEWLAWRAEHLQQQLTSCPK